MFLESFINLGRTSVFMLTKDEAICLVLYLGDGRVSSTTTLQKSLARFLSFLVPLEFDFKLNKYGSYCYEIKEASNTEYYQIRSYDHGKAYEITEEGKQLALEAINKLKSDLDMEEYNKLKEEIGSLAKMRAKDASEDEHNKLLVDEDLRSKLIYRINNVHISLSDLYNEMKNKEPRNCAEIGLFGLIEYAYYLSKFLKEKRFRDIENKGYDYDADMRDYYFLWFLERLIPLLQKSPDENSLDKLYERLKRFAGDYPFSLDNPNLPDLIK